MPYLILGRQIIQLLQDNLGSATYNGFFYGDPHLIGSSSLPAVIVETQDGVITSPYTGLDQSVKTVVVKVVMDKRIDWGASDQVDTTFAKIEQDIEGRDPTTGQYLEKSIVGILRSHYTLADPSLSDPIGPQPYIVDQELRTRYFINQRPGAAGENIYTQEGWVTGTFTDLVAMANRT